MERRKVEFEIKMEGTLSTLKGSIEVENQQSLSSICDQIEKQQGFRENSLTVESPHGSELKDSTLFIILKEKKGMQRKDSAASSIFFEEESIIEKNQSYEFIESQPEAPPKVIGRIQECYKVFSCFSSTKIMVLNFESVRFCTGAIQNLRVTRTIPLREIEEVKPYRKREFYFLRIRTELGDDTDIRFINPDVCKQWLDYFHAALHYHDYLEERQGISRNESFQDFVKTLLQKQKSRVITIEDSTVISRLEKDTPVLRKQSSSYKKSNKASNTCLSDFEITHKIGSGAFSTVYKARNKQNNQLFALKQMSKDTLLYRNQMKYALTEISILKRSVKCPFIIQLGHAFQTEDYLYLALKYQPFGNLKQVLNEKKTLPYSVAFKMLCELVVAIEFLHNQRILYRDLKPENIILNGDGHISLIDFGLSIELQEDEEFAITFVGTPLYLSPERLDGNGKINYKADIYGVGCIFYEMLHGRTPYEAESFNSIVYNIKNTEVEIREDITEMGRFFIQDTLEKNPDKRTSHMSSHPLFEGVNWKNVQKRSEPILKLAPKVSDYVEIKDIGDRDYTEENYPNKKIADWKF